MKIKVPKPLKMKIFKNSEDICFISDSHICFFENGDFIRKSRHHLNHLTKSTIFDLSSRLFAVLCEDEKDDENSVSIFFKKKKFHKNNENKVSRFEYKRRSH